MPFIHEPFPIAEGAEDRIFVPLPVSENGINWLYAVTVRPVANDNAQMRITIFMQPDKDDESLDPIILVDSYSSLQGVSWTGRLPIERQEGPNPSIRVDTFQESDAIRNYQIVILWSNK